MSAHGILVLRALGLGDLLTALPALRGLRRAFPDERMVLAAPRPLSPLIELIDAVDELLPTAGLGELTWPGDPPRLGVNMHGSGPESIADLLAQDIEEMITHRNPDFPDLDGPEWRDDLHEVDRWCALVEHHGVSTDRTELWLPQPPGPALVLNAVIIHPGSACPARRWPADRFAHVARTLASEGHEVVVTGSASEVDIATEVARAADLPASAVLAGYTDLAALAALVADARLVVCNDTGIGHLATAFGTSSVLLFGPTSPNEWGPPAERLQHIALWAGELGDISANQPSPGLLRLREDEVLDAADRLLEKSSRTSRTAVTSSSQYAS